MHLTNERSTGMKSAVIVFFLSILCLLGQANTQDSVPLVDSVPAIDTIPYIQFSGVVVTGDSLIPVPYAHILVVGSNRGSVVDYYGFFSFVARPGETLRFSSVGFKDSYFKIPDTLTGQRYNWIQMMQNDTILLKETVIYPWPTVEELKTAIVELEIPEGDYERAIKNLELEELKERAMSTPMSGAANYQNQIQNIVDRSYWNGQYRPNNLLNPFAWAKFVEAWKNGDFKRKDD